MNKKLSGKKAVIPFTNYVKLLLIVLITIFVAFLLRNWYLSKINYELNIPIIRETLINEINNDEIYSYIRENENSIIYMGVVSDENCREFELEFNEIIREKQLGDQITYLNITKVNNKGKFIKEFNKFYSSSLQGYPSLIIFEEGEVKAALTVKTGKKLKIEDVIKFLNDNDIAATNL